MQVIEKKMKDIGKVKAQGSMGNGLHKSICITDKE